MAERGPRTDPRMERRWKRRLGSPQNPFRSRSLPPLPPTKRLCIEPHKSSPPHPIDVIDIDDDDDDPPPPPPTIIDVSDSSSAGNHDHLDDDLQDQALHARDDHQKQTFNDPDDDPEAESHDCGGKWDPEYKFDDKGNFVIFEGEVNTRNRIISYEVPSNGSPETLNAEAKGKCVSDAIGLAIKSEMVANGFCEGVVTQTPNVGRESLDLMEKMHDGDGLARNCEMNVNAIEVSVDMDADYKLFFDNGMVANGFSGGFGAKMPEAERIRNARVIGYEVSSNGSRGGFVTEKVVDEMPYSSKGKTLNAGGKGTCVSDAIGLAIKSEMVGNGYWDGVVTRIPDVGRESLGVMKKMNGVSDDGGGGDGLARHCEMSVNATEVSVDMDADYTRFFENMREEIEGNVLEIDVGGKTTPRVRNYGMVADGFSRGFVATMPEAERGRNARIIGYGVPSNGSPGGFVRETPNAVIKKVVDEMPCCSKGKTLSADGKGMRVSDAIGSAIKSEMVANGYCDGVVTRIPDVGRESGDGDGNVMEVSVDMDADYKLFFDYMREEIEGNVLELNVGDKTTPLVNNHGMAADGFSGGFVAKMSEAERIRDSLDVMEEKNAIFNDEGHGFRGMEAKSARPDHVGDDIAKDNCVPNGDGGIGVSLVPEFNDEGNYICVVSSDDSGDAEDPVSDCDGEANAKDCSKVNADDDTKYHCVSDSDDGEDHGVADVEYNYVFDGDDAKEHCASGGVDYICVSDSDDSGDAKDHVSDCDGETNGKDCSKVNADDDTKYHCISDSDDGEDYGVDGVKYDSVDAKKHRASGGDDSIFGSKYDLYADDTVDECYKIFLLCLKPDGETVDFTILKGKTVNARHYQNNEAKRYKEEKSNTNKGLKTRSSSSSRGKLKFRKGLMDVLRKPYNQKEYEQLWYEISKRKPVCQNRVLRGVTKQYSGNRIGKSYLDHHPDLASIIKSVKNDKPRVLNLLRGFFHWLKNLCHRGAFVPWKDSLFLETTSYPSVSKRSRGLNHKKVWHGSSKMFCESGIKSM